MLKTEVFTDVTEGDKRDADVVAEIYTLDGKPEMILIHIEVERKHLTTFPARMHDYYEMLRLRHRKKIYPIVIYLTAGAGGLVRETHTEELFEEEIVRFRYSAIGLPDLSADDYLNSDNALAPGLTPLMRVSVLGKIVQKKMAQQKIAVSPLDEARKFLLLNMVEKYLELTAEEEAEYQRLVAKPDAKEVREMISVYEERGIIKGQRRTVLNLLRHKFGELPEDVMQKVEAMQTEGELDTLFDRAYDAATLAELGLSTTV